MFDFVNSFGIDRDTLIGANAVIPVIYFLYRNPKLTLGGTTPFDVLSAANIRLWLTAALLRNVFSGQSDTALRIARTVIQTEPPDEPFPIARLNADMAKAGRPSTFDTSAVEEILDLEYGEARTFLALTLLYQDQNWAFDPHVDHIFPKKLFTKKSMNERGVSPDLQGKYQDWVHRIGNLELLSAKENEEKSSEDFEQWIRTRHDSFLERQLIPKDRNLWKLGNFENFLAKREELIRARFESLFPSAPKQLAEAP